MVDATELGNEEMTAENLEELKAIVTDIKENMMSEKNCNDQLYTIIQTLDGIGTYIERMEQGGVSNTEGQTVLQTNLLEVRNEIAKLNQNIDSTNLSEFAPLVAKLAEKVNRLDIIANNSGIDKQVLANVSAQLEQSFANKLNENSEVLYNQSNTSTNLIKTDIETLNENLKDGVHYLESVIKENAGGGSSVDGSSIKSISEDLVLLSSNIEKSNDNLRRSVIDIFSKIQESIKDVNFPKVTSASGSINVEALQANLEMLKNGLYNLNINATQQYNKMLQVLAEVEVYSKLAEFAEVSSLPSIGALKESLRSNVFEIVSQAFANVDLSESDVSMEQFADAVYNELSNVLGSATKVSEDVKRSELANISKKVDALIPYTRESAKDIKDLLNELKCSISCLQSGDEESDYTYSMQDIESDVAKIRIYLNELGQHINILTQDNTSDEINNIYLTLDAINQKVQKNEQFAITDNIQKMQEDILSISTRVNTLLLSSDKDSENLNSSLEEFGQCFNEINKELKSNVTLEQYSSIENSLDRMNNILKENKNYNELINQSLVMLAEWVDTAGESLTNISQKLGMGINSIEIPEAIDYSERIDALEQVIAQQNVQIAQQQQYIGMMDEKLSVILGQNQQIALQEEKLRQMDERMTTILEFSAKNDASAVMDKMNSIDVKLEKLNLSIGKLTSYVDEE